MLARLAPLGVLLAALIVFGVSSPTAAVHDTGRIAFATNRAQNLTRDAIYSVKPDGKGRRLVALPAPPVSSLVRSPDGTRILFSRVLDSGGQALYVASPWGKGAVRLTPPDFGYVSQEAFSPDGSKVVFVGFVGCGTGGCTHRAIYVVNVDGTGLVAVTENGVQPSWAPDGRRLAYSSGVGGSIYVVGLGGEAPKQIGAGYHPVWAPRGERIAYLVTKGGYGVACVVRSDGSGRRCILGRSAIGVLWSSDATRLAFHQLSCDCVAIVHADGRGLRLFRSPQQSAFPVAWSPDNRRIVYIAGGTHTQMLIRNVSGRSVPRPVTRERKGTIFSNVRWRGGRISYVAYLWYSDYEIAVLNADGTGLRTLTHNDLQDRQPDWSPDGRTIVFVRQSGTTSRLRLIDANGSNERSVTAGDGSQETNPAWSPDGRQIAFVRTARGSYPGSLVVVDRDGGALRTISTEAIYPTKISWSPDGRYIVASARTPLFTSDLYVIGADGSGGHRLVTGREWAGSPAWSPDGSRILFAGAPEPRAENRADLFTIRPDGTGRTRVVQDVSFESLGGRWAPDGTRIIFARGREISHLVTANPDGSGEAELTRNFSGNLDPAWSR